jgi:hypothetical protein
MALNSLLLTRALAGGLSLLILAGCGRGFENVNSDRARKERAALEKVEAEKRAAAERAAAQRAAGQNGSGDSSAADEIRRRLEGGKGGDSAAAPKPPVVSSPVRSILERQAGLPGVTLPGVALGTELDKLGSTSPKAGPQSPFERLPRPAPGVVPAPAASQGNPDLALGGSPAAGGADDDGDEAEEDGSGNGRDGADASAGATEKTEKKVAEQKTSGNNTPEAAPSAPGQASATDGGSVNDGAVDSSKPKLAEVKSVRVISHDARIAEYARDRVYARDLVVNIIAAFDTADKNTDVKKTDYYRLRFASQSPDTDPGTPSYQQLPEGTRSLRLIEVIRVDSKADDEKPVKRLYWVGQSGSAEALRGKEEEVNRVLQRIGAQVTVVRRFYNKGIEQFHVKFALLPKGKKGPRTEVGLTYVATKEDKKIPNKLLKVVDSSMNLSLQIVDGLAPDMWIQEYLGWR